MRSGGGLAGSAGRSPRLFSSSASRRSSTSSRRPTSPVASCPRRASSAPASCPRRASSLAGVAPAPDHVVDQLAGALARCSRRSRRWPASCARPRPAASRRRRPRAAARRARDRCRDRCSSHAQHNPPPVPRYLRPTAPIAADALLPADPGLAMALAQRALVKPLMANHHHGLWGYSGTHRCRARADDPGDRDRRPERRGGARRARRPRRQASDPDRPLRGPRPTSCAPATGWSPPKRSAPTASPPRSASPARAPTRRSPGRPRRPPAPPRRRSRAPTCRWRRSPRS